MKGIILAAGRGRRMKNLTDDKPKCLVEIYGRTLLEWQLLAFKTAGIKEIAIVTGYKRELLVQHNITEFHNKDYATTNMVSSLICAKEWLESDKCIVSYSDIFYHYNAISDLKNHNSDFAITYDKNWLELWEKRFTNPLLDAETFKINEHGIVTEIGKKPKSINEIQGQYMGLISFSPTGWAEFYNISINHEHKEKIFITDVFQNIIDKNNAIKIYGLPYDLPWGEVDTESDLQLYEKEYKKWETIC